MYTVGIITISDKCSQGEREDKSSLIIKDMLLEKEIYDVKQYSVVSDDINYIEEELKKYVDSYQLNLVITTGGTGASNRDNTPEATKNIMDKEMPGISEYMRMKSSEVTLRGILSRGISAIRKDTLIINLPGSPKAVKENLGFIIDVVPHALDMMISTDIDVKEHKK